MITLQFASEVYQATFSMVHATQKTGRVALINPALARLQRQAALVNNATMNCPMWATRDLSCSVKLVILLYLCRN